MSKVVILENAAIFHRGKKSKPILRDVTLSIEPGELVYIVGMVGSGKSSLLKTIYGELPLRSGRGQVCGVDLVGLNSRKLAELRRRMGIVFQEYNLLTDMTVYQNLEFILRATGWVDTPSMNRRIEKVLDTVEMRGKAYELPGRISGGERQRVCIARALLNEPQLLVADEPTGNLDPQAAAATMELFHRITSMGCAVIIATHSSENVRLYPGHTIECASGFIETVL